MSSKATEMRSRPLASISIDLDNQWSYMRTYGAVGWQKHPSYLASFIPDTVELLNSLDVRTTVFVVGQDATSQENMEVIKLLADEAHELANHSYNHEPWLNLHTRDAIRKEILETEEALYMISGEKPVGFRGPGFSWSNEIMEVLCENGYIYDSTTFPTCLGPIARAYYFRNPNLSDSDKEKRKEVLGGFAEARRPLKPYYWVVPNKTRLLEIPITTMPFIRTPFHMSYLLFLGRYSVFLMIIYLRIAMNMCIRTGTEPCFIIHPTDLLSKDQVPEMAFFPGMELSAEYKLHLFKKVMGELSKRFKLVNMRCHAETILKRGDLPERNE